MLEKNKQKLQRKIRPTWVGYYSRKTPTKAEMVRKTEKKYKGREIVKIPLPILFYIQKPSNLRHSVINGKTQKYVECEHYCDHLQLFLDGGIGPSFPNRLTFSLPHKVEVEQVAGIEPAQSVWKTEVLTDIRYLHFGGSFWIRTRDRPVMSRML